MLIKAAKESLGIALIPTFLIQEELNNNQLTIPFKTPYQSPYNYYLIYAKTNSKNQTIKKIFKILKK